MTSIGAPSEHNWRHWCRRQASRRKVPKASGPVVRELQLVPSLL